MSYILKALQKSQQERDRGKVPTLISVPGPTPPPNRRPSLWWLGAAMLNVIAFALLIWWMGGFAGLGRSAVKEVEVGTPIAPERQQAEAHQPETISEPPLQSPLTPLNPTSHEHSIPAKLPVDGRAPEGQPPVAQFAVSPERRTSTSSGEPSTSVQVADNEINEAGSGVAPGTDQEIAVVPAPSTNSDTYEPNTATAPSSMNTIDHSPPNQTAALPALQPLTEVQQVAVASPKEPTTQSDAYGSLPLRRQLSYTIQTVLPEFKISIHVYAESSQDRFIIVDRRKYQEGDHLGNDLILVAIAPNGAILRYQDTKFRVDR